MPREPPPPATPLSFPAYTPDGSRTFSDDSAKENFAKLFTSLKKPSDVTAEHIDALKVRVTRDVALEELVPRSFLPPPSWSESPAKLPASEFVKPECQLSNGSKAPGHEIYYVRLQELLFDNDAAFRRVLRQPPRPGQQPVTPAHFRKFWVNLELMAEYWDTTVDSESESPTKEPGQSAMDIDHTDSDKGPDNGALKTYKGRRTGTGSHMPELYRDDTVRYFVETIAWAFGCQVTPPRTPPRIKVQNCLLPVRHNSLVYRSPTDRQSARQGLAEGPLLAIQCRPDTTFRTEDEGVGEGSAEKLDLLREIGAMLLLAQQRAREGHEEKSPGQGEWWTTKARWGGGPGGEVANQAENSDEGPPPAKRGRRKENALESYKALHPPAGTWDRKLTYLRIGKDPNCESDTVSFRSLSLPEITELPSCRRRIVNRSTQIYMISSLNHHISILHMLVSPAYLHYLSTGTTPATTVPAPQNANSCPPSTLELRRSRWYDLLDAGDRAEAMRGVWGVMAWLMRAT